MSRVRITSKEAQEVVTRRLVPLFLALGSTASLVKALNEGLSRAGLPGRIHANRIHALLSGDETKALNASTLETITAASEEAFGQPGMADRADATGQALRDEARRLHAFSGATPEAVASLLSVPYAVATALLAEHRSLVANEWMPRSESSTTPPPDWSYQNTAVNRCLEALSKGPAPRVGLVLPTGGGKTRTALRVILAKLRESSASRAPALWVTHRKNLREQAYRELQKLIASGQSSESDLALASRIKFVMVGSLEKELCVAQPVLIVIDEAHHAAAETYQPAFANLPPAPLLLLTATPNRTDGLPIGIDEIAFTITYRELAERGAVLIPEFLDFPVENFDWSPEAIDQLAQFVIERCQSSFAKVLVLAPRIDRVREFYDALVRLLPSDHPMEHGDLGYIHGSGNSMGIDNEDFLERFAAKPRAVLVSAQLLLEGFDDPAIDTVVITYPSTSMVRLMQAAGRCVRYSPGKGRAFVVQARNDDVAYHFDHRWLYQEISDYLRPHVVDVEYSSLTDLQDQMRALLAEHRVSPESAAQTLHKIATLKPGDPCRIFAYGLPHFGNVEDFGSAAKWGVVLEAAGDGNSVRAVFNEFCERGADASDPTPFLEGAGARFGIRQSGASNSPWRRMVGLLTAAYCAKCEVHGPEVAIADSRPYTRSGATTWLKYINFVYRPKVPAELMAFLDDCHNREAVCAEFALSPGSFATAVKVPLPLAGAEAFLLDPACAEELQNLIEELRGRLSAAPPADQIALLAGFLVSVPNRVLPRLFQRIEFLISSDAHHERFLRLNHAS